MSIEEIKTKFKGLIIDQTLDPFKHIPLGLKGEVLIEETRRGKEVLGWHTISVENLAKHIAELRNIPDLNIRLAEADRRGIKKLLERVGE